MGDSLSRTTKVIESRLENDWDGRGSVTSSSDDAEVGSDFEDGCEG